MGFQGRQIRKWPIAAYIIMALSVVSLPFALYLAVHPKAGHVPPSLIVLPLGMFGVGLDMALPGQIWRRLLRWASLVLLVVWSVVTIAFYYHESYVGLRGFQIGKDPGQYAPQNFFIFVFLVSLFFHTSQ